MSWTCVSSNHTCKARKKHRCNVCDQVIAVGDTQVTRTGVEPGEGFYTMHMHPECQEWSDREFDWDDWESHSPGECPSRAEMIEENAKAAKEGA